MSYFERARGQLLYKQRLRCGDNVHVWEGSVGDLLWLQLGEESFVTDSANLGRMSMPRALRLAPRHTNLDSIIELLQAIKARTAPDGRWIAGTLQSQLEHSGAEEEPQQ